MPTDFSPCARVGVDYAVMLARRLAARLDLLYMSQVPAVLAGDAIAAGRDFVDADIVEGRRRMTELVDEIRRAGVADCAGELLAGYGAETIVEHANAGPCDLLVISTRTGVRRWWMGSVVEQVVRRAHIPVLTVHPSESPSVG